MARPLTVLDASALVAGMLDEPGRPAVERILRGPKVVSILAHNLGEVVDTLVRGRAQDAGEVRDRIHLLIVDGLEIEPVWLRVMWLATDLRATYYDSSKTPVSLADCICIATAIALDTDLATTDAALATVARSAGVEVIGLPDSNGVSA